MIQIQHLHHWAGTQRSRMQTTRLQHDHTIIHERQTTKFGEFIGSNLNCCFGWDSCIRRWEYTLSHWCLRKRLFDCWTAHPGYAAEDLSNYKSNQLQSTTNISWLLQLPSPKKNIFLTCFCVKASSRKELGFWGRALEFGVFFVCVVGFLKGLILGRQSYSQERMKSLLDSLDDI